MNDARLREIEARLAETTPGPWRHGSLWDNLEPVLPQTSVVASEEIDRDGLKLTHTYAIAMTIQHVVASRHNDDEAEGDEEIEAEAERREYTDWLCRSEKDARFLAHATEDVADLLAEVHRLRALLGETESEP